VNRYGFPVLLALLLVCPGVALPLHTAEPGASSPFSVAALRLEQNATDGDGEVVFEVKGNSEGLKRLHVVSPDGRTVLEFTAPDPSMLGMRQFVFESPEPKEIDTIKSAFPEGAYRFSGVTTSGATLSGEAKLSHTLPPPVSLIRPEPDGEGVEARGLQIAWKPLENLAAYIVTLEQPELGMSMSVRLPGSVSTCAVPDGFLRPGTSYELAIGTVTDAGNASFIETSFITADAP
jgi:hypothetical protein